MELDPHTLQLIIQRIYQQMRCPQCGKRVPVDFNSVRMASDDFMLLQLKCDTCDAYIVLHASLQGAEQILKQTTEDETVNASSTLHLRDEEVTMLRDGLKECGGSFEALFQRFGPKPEASDKGTRLA
jgi:hypothetical protein